ncbi:MAG: hypothetical protein HY287_17560 [Planctomycetes bacterium]|nr:hypothetical protein [Planctomycetota bacterium]
MLKFPRSLATTKSLDEVFNTIIDTAAQLLCCRRVSILMPDAEPNTLRITQSQGIDEDVTADVLADLRAAIPSSPAANGSLNSVTGRYLQVSVSFTRSNSDQGPVSPVLCDPAVRATCGK